MTSLAERLQALDAASSPGPWRFRPYVGGHSEIWAGDLSIVAAFTKGHLANARLAALAKHLTPLVRDAQAVTKGEECWHQQAYENGSEDHAYHGAPCEAVECEKPCRLCKLHNTLAALEADVDGQESSGA